MTIKQLTNEIFEKSFSRETLERLLTKEIKKKVEKCLLLRGEDLENPIEKIISETLKSE